MQNRFQKVLMGVFLGVSLGSVFIHYGIRFDMPDIPSLETFENYTDKAIPQMDHPEFYYWYQTLDEEGQVLYREMFYGLQDIKKSIPISDSDRATDIFTCVMLDHPELFWLSESDVSIHTYLGRSTLILDYKTDRDEILKQKEKIEAEADSILATVSGMETAYDKIKAIYDFVLEKTSYLEGSVYNQDIRSVFLNGQSVCKGYAASMQYLLNRAGIPCTLIRGTIPKEANAAHAWNMVKMEEEYYFIDATWGDTQYSSNPKLQEVLKYKYLLCDYERIHQTHAENLALNVPLSNDDRYNIFRLYGSWYEKYDRTLLSEKMQEGISNGVSIIQFSSNELYQKAKTDIEQSNILERILFYQGSKKSCRYYLLGEENAIFFLFE